MICYERGCFQLDDALSKYCPEWASTQVLAGGDADEPELVDQETPITIKQLFTHTAGLPPLGPSQAGKINARVQRALRQCQSYLRDANALGEFNILSGEERLAGHRGEADAMEGVRRAARPRDSRDWPAGRRALREGQRHPRLLYTSPSPRD